MAHHRPRSVCSRPVRCAARERLITARGAAALGLLALLCSLACIEGGPSTGGLSSVEGTVQGEPFQMYSGTAERLSTGYAVTLADSFDYGCVSTPSGGYLQVTFVTSGVGTIDAEGNVTFSSVTPSSSPSTPADAGLVTIDTIDETASSLTGSIRASNSDSDVSGSFEVEICP